MTHMMFPFSSQIIEATNGALMIALGWMILFALLYLLNMWRSCRSWTCVYYEAQAAIAGLLVIIGLEIRTSILWYFRHYEIQYTDVALGLLGVTLGSFLALWGAICWIKVVTPFLPKHSWAFLAGTSILFGITMAWWK